MSDDFDVLRAEITTDPLARGYAGMSNIAIATSLNTANRSVAVQRALLAPTDILNAIVPADLASLTQIQTSQLSMLLSGSLVDVSVGSAVRAAIRALFAGKTTTLSQLNALVAGVLR
jgi:hypothetical protein